MKRTTKNAARKGQLAVIRRDDHNGLLAHFAQCPELFAPMLNLIANGKQTVIVFNKGQSSSGGTISVAGGGVVSLRTTVQAVSYTDNGIVWQ